MKPKDYVKLEFPITLPDFDFVYAAIQHFAFQLNPSRKELKEIKVAVSEAISNSCLHAYPVEDGPVIIKCSVPKPFVLEIAIKDKGIGIEDVDKARKMLSTSTVGYSGLGFTVMEELMDEVIVKSKPGKSTTVRMRKTITGK